MSAQAAQTEAPPVAERTRATTASLIIRRIHMFLGLFLVPWMAMYALSTLVMTHRNLVASLYPTESPALVTERELDYSRSFPAATSPKEMGHQILIDLGLDGTHRVSGGKNGKPLVIYRQHAWAQQQIAFDPTTGKLRVQREEFRALTFLERMHRRRGYDQPYVLEDTWAASVDLAVAAMVFWSLSGIWLWWELGPTRRWGTVALISGLALFALFAVLLGT